MSSDFELSTHLSLPRLIRVAIPSILMMISISIYSVVDGFFVSNYAGKTPFAAVNIIWPLIMIAGTIGFMMGTGGSALVAKKFGEGKEEEGRNCFAICVLTTIVIGIIASVSIVFFLPNIAEGLGADEEMVPYCVDYGRIMILGITFFNLQNLFQPFFATAERPRMGFIITIAAGVTNIVLDAVLIVGFKLGIVGAAIGTVCGQAVGGVIPLIYFLCKNKSRLSIRIHKMDFPAVGRMAYNGFSEFASNISASAVSMVMNVLLMKHYGENGVSAYGIIAYVWMIFAAVFIGYYVSVSPRFSYHYGAKNNGELQSLLNKSLIILFIFGLVQFALAEALTIPLSYAYAGYDEGLMQLTRKAMSIYSIIFIVLGINMFGSSFFTALNNGAVSAFLAVARLTILEISSILVMAAIFGGEGIWWGVVCGEVLGLGMNIVFIILMRTRYGYHWRKPKKRE